MRLHSSYTCILFASVHQSITFNVQILQSESLSNLFNSKIIKLQKKYLQPPKSLRSTLVGNMPDCQYIFVSHIHLSLKTVRGIWIWAGILCQVFSQEILIWLPKNNRNHGKKAIHLNILNNSSISESPGKRGRWFTISANMHPTDQISTGVE